MVQNSGALLVMVRHFVFSEFRDTFHLFAQLVTWSISGCRFLTTVRSCISGKAQYGIIGEKFGISRQTVHKVVGKHQEKQGP